MKKLLTILIIIPILILTVDVIRFPESYISTWKYQLQNDINNGDEMAIDYYERNYIANNRPLFE